MKSPTEESHVATSIHDSTLLGAFLRKSGKISDNHLDRALRTQKENPSAKLGQILIDENLLHPDDLNEHLNQQKLLRSIYDFATGSWIIPKTSIGQLLVAKKIITEKHLEGALEQQSKSQKRLGEILVEKGLAEDHHIKQVLKHQRSSRKILVATIAALIAASVSFAPMAEAGATGMMHISLTIIPSLTAQNAEENEANSGNIFSLDDISFTQDSSGEYTVSYESSKEIKNQDYSISTEFEHPENSAKGVLNFYINAE